MKTIKIKKDEELLEELKMLVFSIDIFFSQIVSYDKEIDLTHYLAWDKSSNVTIQKLIDWKKKVDQNLVESNNAGV